MRGGGGGGEGESHRKEVLTSKDNFITLVFTVYVVADVATCVAWGLQTVDSQAAQLEGDT